MIEAIQTSIELTDAEAAEWQGIWGLHAELQRQELESTTTGVRQARAEKSRLLAVQLDFVQEVLRRRGYDPGGHAGGGITGPDKNGRYVLTTNARKVTTEN